EERDQRLDRAAAARVGRARREQQDVDVGAGVELRAPVAATATRAQPGSAAQWRLHASRSTVSASAAREWTSSSTGSEERKRALSSSWAERRSSRHAAGSRPAASRAGRVSSSGQEIGGGGAGRG